MPVITINCSEINRLLSKEISVDELKVNLIRLGLDIEDSGADWVKAEYNPNRPDYCSVEGVARSLKGILEIETGFPIYQVKKGDASIKVDETVKGVRPYIVSCIIRDVKLDEERIQTVMNIQEDLHWAVGRDRKKAAIGIHDLDNIKPPFTYKAVDPDSVSFIPLGEIKEMNLREILEYHPKGIAYAHLLENKEKYPIITDVSGVVLSFPPIINGVVTQVTEDTKNFLIEVTGTDFDTITHALNILAVTFADMEGTIESVKIIYPDKSVETPDLTPEIWKLNPEYVNKILGLNLSDEEIVKCLNKVRLGARKIDNYIEVKVPAYRRDILHERDLVEEVAIGYGYDNFEPTFPKVVTIGEPHLEETLAETVRLIMMGLGFQEVVNFTLTNERVHFNLMGLKDDGNYVKVMNPVSQDYTMIRRNIIPSLMQVLHTNRHVSLPQKIFEVGYVLELNEKSETGSDRVLKVAGAIIDDATNFNEIKADIEALLENLGVRDYAIKAVEHPSFIEGRAASIIINGTELGILGEIHPQVLNNFQLEYPVTAFELDLSKFIK
ncbi:MAG: phenylalanine--tRNA ligase subunit beta [Candidatus Odinarchaeia archaeon]